MTGNTKPDRRADRLLRFPEVHIRTGLSESTMRRREAIGTFPPRVQMGPKMVGWYESDIDAWISNPKAWNLEMPVKSAT